MKNLLLLTVFFATATIAFGQKEKQKAKKETPKQEARNKVLGKQAENTKKDQEAIWDGMKDTDGGKPKPTKNQPAKVRAAFQKDYPGVRNVSWSKYRGDWTATFQNGLLTSTAVYHANGERKDTRTRIERAELPKTIEDIIKRKPVSIADIIRIQIPKSNDLFRLKTTTDGKIQFQFFDADGKVVQYDY